jgi:hypothetical protein
MKTVWVGAAVVSVTEEMAAVEQVDEVKKLMPLLACITPSATVMEFVMGTI